MMAFRDFNGAAGGSGDYLMLDSDTNAAASFSAVNGEYAFRLTVTRRR